MAITITQISSQNWQDYRAIRLEALKENPHAFGSSYDMWFNAADEKWQERSSNPDSIILLAKDDAIIIGLIGVHFEHTEAEIWGMYVNKAYRGMGVGKLLMQNLLDKIYNNARDTEKTTLMVNPQQISAVKLYKSLGFKKIGIKEYVLGDGNQYKLDVMEKLIRDL